MRPYYQTTPLSDEQLRGAFRLASKQDELVLAVFRANPGRLLRPSQVHAIGQQLGSRWLLTSVRRSISTLTAATVLVKTDHLDAGPHGKPEYRWRLADSAGAV